MGTKSTQDDGWAMYSRLSSLPKKRRGGGRRRGEFETVERQQALNRKWAAEQGIAINERHVYVDNNLSAWNEDGERPDWDKLIAAAERREFPGIVIYAVSRFTRNAPDGNRMVKLGEQHGIGIAGPNSGRYDLRTAQGRKDFADAVTAAKFESDLISERVRAAFDDLVPRGLPMGQGRGYGFELLDDESVQPRQRPEEVEMIREAARRATDDGEPLSKIADDLNRRGYRTVRGNLWTGNNLARMLARPRYGGYIVRHGEIVEGARLDGEPVLDAELFARVQAMLGGRRKGPKVNAEKYPMSGVARCGRPECNGHTMAGNSRPHHGRVLRSYACPRTAGGCGQSILAEPVERAVRARVVADSADQALRDAIAARTRRLTKAKLAALAKLDTIEGQLTALEVRYTTGSVIERAYQASKAQLDKNRDAELAKLEKIGKQSAESGGGEPVDALTVDDWEDMPADQQRAIFNRLHLSVTIMPPRPGAPRNRVDHDRIVVNR